MADASAASSPVAALRHTALPEPERLAKGLDAMHLAVHGWVSRRRSTAASLLALALEAGKQETAIHRLADDALRAELRTCAAACRRCGVHLPREQEIRALALLREASVRAWGMRPYDVQLAASAGLARGWLIEMATGEGKTLSIAIAAAVAGWRRKPCHVVTVNDYLAQRDATHFKALGDWTALDVAAVTGEMTPAQRQLAYQSAVVYTTGKELLADFLRDRLVLGEAGNPERLALRQLSAGQPVARRLVQRGLHTAIVDEADSVLIDDAVTPLIISRPEPNEDLRQACIIAHGLAGELQAGTDYRLDAAHRKVDLTRRGEALLAGMAASLPPLWRGDDRRRELVERALEAASFFERDHQYIVDGGKVTIVDELSGRLMPQRTWREGLHQAIEVREGLAVSSPSTTLARMSFQRFFRLFPRLSGMTGTARESAAEFWRIYRLTTVAVPTNRPVIRERYRSVYFVDKGSKWAAVVDETIAISDSGRPVLVGTRSIEESEKIATLMQERGRYARVLNARTHAEEAGIIAGAGERYAITIATNMAGRGTDIRLGQGVAGLGGLHVISTSRSDSGRVDRQLLGRAGRQGDPGSGRLYASLEDELLQRVLPGGVIRLLQSIPHRFSNVSRSVMPALFRYAQAASARRAFRQRRSVLTNDQWLEDSLGFAGRKQI